MNHSAISNPYYMESQIKDRTPAEIQVNGKRGRCHNHGIVPVKVVKTLHLGKINTGKVDADGNKVFEPVAIKLCSICNSVIQSPIPATPPKKVTPEDGKVNQKVYALLAHLIHGEREGCKLAKMLEVSQPTMWTYLWELKRNGLIYIHKEGRNASLRMVDVTEEGYHHFDVEKRS